MKTCQTKSKMTDQETVIIIGFFIAFASICALMLLMILAYAIIICVAMTVMMLRVSQGLDPVSEPGRFILIEEQIPRN